MWLPLDGTNDLHASQDFADLCKDAQGDVQVADNAAVPKFRLIPNSCPQNRIGGFHDMQKAGMCREYPPETDFVGDRQLHANDTPEAVAERYARQVNGRPIMATDTAYLLGVTHTLENKRFAGYYWKTPDLVFGRHLPMDTLTAERRDENGEVSAEGERITTYIHEVKGVNGEDSKASWTIQWIREQIEICKEKRTDPDALRVHLTGVMTALNIVREDNTINNKMSSHSMWVVLENLLAGDRIETTEPTVRCNETLNY